MEWGHRIEDGDLALIELAVDITALCQVSFDTRHVAEAHLETPRGRVRPGAAAVRCGNGGSGMWRVLTLARILPGVKSTVVVATAPARSGYGGAIDAP